MYGLNDSYNGVYDCFGSPKMTARITNVLTFHSMWNIITNVI